MKAKTARITQTIPTRLDPDFMFLTSKMPLSVVLNISRHRSTNKTNPEQIGRKRRKQTNAKNSAGSDDKCPMECGVKFIALGSVSEFSKLLGSALVQPSAPDRKD